MAGRLQTVEKLSVQDVFYVFCLSYLQAKKADSKSTWFFDRQTQNKNGNVSKKTIQNMDVKVGSVAF